jgi:hypothetical protein
MNQFVNYGNRDVSLPKGCKDLMDLLHPHREEAPGMIQRTTEGVRQLGSCLSSFLSSPREYCLVSILSFERESGVFLERFKGVLSAIVVLKNAGSTEGRTVRECFRLAGVTPLSDNVVEGCGGSRVLRYPLPASIPDVMKVIAEVLRAACGATEYAGLYYHLHGSHAA